MKKIPSAAFVALLSLTACASLPPPSQETMGAMPVVTYGQLAPAGTKEFILHYPAGTRLPVEASVTGSLLEREDRATLTVALKRDVYVYKHWASLDGKTWQRGSDVASGRFAVVLPGEADGRSPGRLSAEFNQK